jgi:acetyl-CoA synthetase
LWEGDEAGKTRAITYKELLREVCRIANVLKSFGIRKGDTVAIYMPMIPEAAFAMLACARIGAVHSVVFGGFSATALRDRVLDCQAKVVITADEVRAITALHPPPARPFVSTTVAQGMRGGRPVPLKVTVDTAIAQCACVHAVLVVKHSGRAVPWHSRDHWLHDLTERQRPYCPAEVMDSEDTLFLLYTSGAPAV